MKGDNLKLTIPAFLSITGRSIRLNALKTLLSSVVICFLLSAKNALLAFVYQHPQKDCSERYNVHLISSLQLVLA